ncbi:MAG: outer membrane protein assembly factor BamB family protein [Planctomycetota bacterium]
MRRRALVYTVALVLLGTLPREAAHGGTAESIIKASGVKAGLCVHLGVTDGKLTAGLSSGGTFVVHGLAPDAAGVEKARAFIAARGVYGLVSVERSDMKRLPYAENLVNLVVVSGAGGQVSGEEIARVLAPGGVVLSRAPLPDTRHLKPGTSPLAAWKKAVKPRPAEMGEWTHALHAADCNPVSDDMLVGPAVRVRWLDGPRWGKHGSGVGGWVSSGGRIFYVFHPKRYGHAGGRQLVARDAFNGRLLWSRPMDWKYVRNGRMQLLRPNKHHLVAVGERVYAVLENRGNLLALDAATGETVHTYEDIKGPGEFLLHEGKLLVTTGKEVRAVEPGSGKVLWRASASGKICVGEGKVFAEHYAGKGQHQLTCLGLADGEQVWQHTAAPRNSGSFHHFYYRGAVVLTDRKTIDGYSAADGEKMWSFAAVQAMRGSIHEVVYGARGLVWTHAYFDGNSKSNYKSAWFGLDPKTGEVKKRFVDKDPQAVVHDRHKCCPDHATEKYFLYGTCNYVDTLTGETIRYRGTRTTCGSGFFPANGMSYFTPFACGCASWMRGFRAMAPAAAKKLPESPDGSRL